jgi:hypothetical protein
MARTAVVAGTASAVVGASANRQAAKQQSAADQQAANQAAFDSQAQLADMQAQMNAMAAQQATPAPAPAGGDMMDQLAKLGELKASGVLSDEEFAAAKAKLLA